MRKFRASGAEAAFATEVSEAVTLLPIIIWIYKNHVVILHGQQVCPGGSLSAAPRVNSVTCSGDRHGSSREGERTLHCFEERAMRANRKAVLAAAVAAGVAAALFAGQQSLHAANLTWDKDGINGNPPAGGTGTWNLA